MKYVNGAIYTFNEQTYEEYKDWSELRIQYMQELDTEFYYKFKILKDIYKRGNLYMYEGDIWSVARNSNFYKLLKSRKNVQPEWL